MTQQKLLARNQIVEDIELYPRNHYNWFLGNKYAKAMRTGATFPPIVVAYFAGKYYLVDGKHRLEALKINKEVNVQAEVLKGLSRAKIFAEAVKRNVVHGAALSTQETANCISKLRNLNFSDVQISKIVNIPANKIEKFVADRITNSITGEEIALKAPLKHLAGEEVSEEVLANQGVYSAKSQVHVVDQMLMLLETGAFNTRNESVMNKLKMVHKLIKELVLSTRRK